VFEFLAHKLLILSGKFKGSYLINISTSYHRVYSTLHQLSHTVQFNLSVTDVHISVTHIFVRQCEVQFRTEDFHGENQYSYLLTERSRVLLERLTGFQPVTKFPAFHGTRRFITTFTSARQLSVS